ncbi:MAG: recombination protein RecR [Deltaproteobacteria bacterium]|nr:recombination protein RecR [Deltaproteobacteria bacterium]
MHRHHFYPPTMRALINEFSKLPSIGEKSATRLAYHLLTSSDTSAKSLALAITKAKEQITLCEICFALSESSTCSICSDSQRHQQIICVVEKPADIIALERSGRYGGLYHVLHGLWSPLKGVSPEKTKIGNLLQRVRNSFDDSTAKVTVQEVILATSTTVEGDATALYIAKSLSSFNLNITRIAQGLPKGGELEYADELTLSHAIDGRSKLK